METPKTEKYKELFEYSKHVFEKEDDRFKSIDTKAALYLSTLTLLIGIAGFFITWVSENFIPSKNCSEGFLLALAVLSLVSLVAAWIQVFYAVRIQSVKMLPLDKETLDFFNDEKEIDIYYYMSKGIKKALEINRDVGDSKAKTLKVGYKFICLSAIFLIVFSVSFGIYRWNNPQKYRKITITMPEQNDQQNPNPQPANPPVDSGGNDANKPTPGKEPPNFPTAEKGGEVYYPGHSPNNIKIEKG